MSANQGNGRLKDGMIEKLQRLWCEHCLALQKANKTYVVCLYVPFSKEAYFCGANEDAVRSLLSYLDSCHVVVDKTQDYSTGEVVIESLPQLTRADGL